MSRRKPKRDTHTETRQNEVKPGVNSAYRLPNSEDPSFGDFTKETELGDPAQVTAFTEGSQDASPHSGGVASSSDDNLHSNHSEPDLLLPEAGEDGLVKLTVESRAHGWRLDHYLSRLFSNHSRGQLKKSIDSGDIVLNGLQAKASRRLKVNNRIDVRLLSLIHI